MALLLSVTSLWRRGQGYSFTQGENLMTKPLLYPKMLYHESYRETKKVIVVPDREAEYALGRGWFFDPDLTKPANTPPTLVEMPAPTAPPPPPESESAAVLVDETPLVLEPVAEEPVADELAAFLNTETTGKKSKAKK